ISSVPFIFLSAKGEEWDTIHGLKLGGDDYIVKPFKPGELLARIETVLRRVYSKKIESDILTVGNLVINNKSFQAKLDGNILSLTRKEFDLLSTLAKNRNR